MVSASIVTYKHSFDEIKELVYSIVDSESIGKLFIVDNSPFDCLESEIDTNNKIEYCFVGKNLGFGAAHNIAIKKAIEYGADYHFIVNPDIIIKEAVIKPMVEFMSSNPNIGMVMPRVLYPNGDVQFLPKLLPSPFDILKRKLKKPGFLRQKFIQKYELRGFSNAISNVPILSGCFTLLNLKAIKEIGAYDDRFFMYFEDFDLSRRMHKKYQTIYYPLVSVYHGYEGGANKNAKLFIIFIKSAIKYFNKWGWFFDFERRSINKKALNNLK
jgi:GT2 family glycosyltransferase